jgi:hypothetical protein
MKWLLPRMNPLTSLYDLKFNNIPDDSTFGAAVSMFEHSIVWLKI